MKSKALYSHDLEIKNERAKICLSRLERMMLARGRERTVRPDLGIKQSLSDDRYVLRPPDLFVLHGNFTNTVT